MCNGYYMVSHTYVHTIHHSGEWSIFVVVTTVSHTYIHTIHHSGEWSIFVMVTMVSRHIPMYTQYIILVSGQFL